MSKAAEQNPKRRAKGGTKTALLKKQKIKKKKKRAREVIGGKVKSGLRVSHQQARASGVFDALSTSPWQRVSW